jgi:hypothetical protein
MKVIVYDEGLEKNQNNINLNKKIEYNELD